MSVKSVSGNMNTDPGRYVDPGTLGKVPRNTSVDPGNRIPSKYG
jgi:hypothetical protein